MTRSDIQALVEACEEHFTDEHTFSPIDDTTMFQAISAVKYHLQAAPKHSVSQVTSPELIQAVTYLATLAKPLADDDLDIDLALMGFDIE